MGLWSSQSWKMVSSNKGMMISWREQQMGMVMSSLIIFINLQSSDSGCYFSCLEDEDDGDEGVRCCWLNGSSLLCVSRFRLCVRLVCLPWFCFSSFVPSHPLYFLVFSFVPPCSLFLFFLFVPPCSLFLSSSLLPLFPSCTVFALFLLFDPPPYSFFILFL
ncbi:hypothetical protein BDE02_11G011700 [Populus trichocarpa]|nr:hypothetical protein BDE02_11G011700 [Populus trichocarpa]